MKITNLYFPTCRHKTKGKTQDEDLALEKELLADEKECSEHNMLVDLGRNDLGKICKFGSVHVDEYMKIERFSTRNAHWLNCKW